MKHLFSSFAIIIIVSVLAGCSKTISDTSITESKQEEYTIVEQEETFLNIDESIENELRNAWGKSYSKVETNDGVVRLYFLRPIDAVFFLEARPDERALKDLVTFVEITGYSTGMIEYYIPPPSNTKIFSISGSPTDAKTKKYH